MKKLLLRCTTGFIPFIALASSVYAQNSNPGSSPASPISSEVAFTKAANKHSTAPGNRTSVNINEKALKNFNKTHKKNGDAKWFVISDGFLAEFHDNGIKTKVFYNRKGTKTASMRTYFEDNLPKNIRHLVKSRYYDYNIYLVQEISASNVKAYLVKLEGKSSFKTIRVVDGEMDEYEAFDKASNSKK